jgi:hypothetical protein
MIVATVVIKPVTLPHLVEVVVIVLVIVVVVERVSDIENQRSPPIILHQLAKFAFVVATKATPGQQKPEWQQTPHLKAVVATKATPRQQRASSKSRRGNKGHTTPTEGVVANRGHHHGN